MITRESTFHDVFGDYSNAYSEEERKLRWQAYKKAIGKRQASEWNDVEACAVCKYLNQKESWCKEYGLPCTVNPVFGFSMLGMACRGADFEALEPELELFNNTANG